MFRNAIGSFLYLKEYHEKKAGITCLFLMIRGYSSSSFKRERRFLIC